MIGQLHRVIHDIEHEWANKRLLVVGDVMLDKYVWGEVGRISPEAPVPVVRGMHQDEKPGGAANVAMNLARLGAQTVVAGITGGDENEKLLAASLRSNKIDPHFIASEGFPTITKTRILGGRQQMLRLDFERTGTRRQGRIRPPYRRGACLFCPAFMRSFSLTMQKASSLPRCARRSFPLPASWVSPCWWTPKASTFLLSRRHHNLPQSERTCRVPRG